MVGIGSFHHENTDKLHTRERLSDDGNVHPTNNVNVSENDDLTDEQIFENLDSGTERSFLSQRQCRLIYQQFRNN